jgi:DNA-binding LacI/PurR family transcriptional regulator
MKERISMRTIAERAHCSQMTVSKALRNAPGISQSMREKIRKLARRMGYTPNPLVSALMASRGARRGGSESGTVIAVVRTTLPPDQIEHPNVDQILQGIRERASQSGFLTDDFRLGPLGADGRALHKVLRARGIRGMILLPLSADATFEGIPFANYAFGSVGSAPIAQKLPNVDGDCFGNMLLTLRQLEGLGYRRPGLVMSAGLEAITDLRYHGGFIAAVDSSPNLTQLPIHLLWNPGTRMTLGEWFNRNNPDVIISGVETLPFLEAAGIQIPRDTAFAVIDRHSQMNQLAGFTTNFEMIGSVAVDLVTSQLYRNEFGLPQYPKRVVVPGAWIHGLSAPEVSVSP